MKRIHNKSEEANEFKGVVTRDIQLSQRKRYLQISSGVLSEANRAVSESPAFSPFGLSKETSTSSRLSEFHTDRAASKTSTTLASTGFSPADN